MAIIESSPFSDGFSEGFGAKGRVTRLSAHGGARGLYGTFAPKAEGAATVTAAVTGAGKSKQRRSRRYPRYVFVNGERYRVYSAAEERALLNRLYAEAAKEQAAAAARNNPVKARAVSRRKARIEKRIMEVDPSAEAHLAQLREEDELILLTIH